MTVTQMSKTSYYCLILYLSVGILFAFSWLALIHLNQNVFRRKQDGKSSGYFCLSQKYFQNKNSVLQLGILVDSVWIPAILKDNQIKYTMQGARDNGNKINDF